MNYWCLPLSWQLVCELVFKSPSTALPATSEYHVLDCDAGLFSATLMSLESITWTSRICKHSILFSWILTFLTLFPMPSWRIGIQKRVSGWHMKLEPYDKTTLTVFSAETWMPAPLVHCALNFSTVSTLPGQAEVTIWPSLVSWNCCQGLELSIICVWTSIVSAAQLLLGERPRANWPVESFNWKSGSERMAELGSCSLLGTCPSL